MMDLYLKPLLHFHNVCMVGTFEPLPFRASAPGSLIGFALSSGRAGRMSHCLEFISG